MNWLVYGVCVVLLLAFLQWVAHTAALRGQKGDAMQDWIQRFLRLVFFVAFFFPVFLSFPPPSSLSSLSLSSPSLYIYPLLSLYLITYLDLSELRGGRPSVVFKGLPLWRFYKWYLKLGLVTEIEDKLKDDGKSYIFCVHPHAIIPFGGILNITSPVNNFDGLIGKLRLRGLAASFCFFIPGYRDLLLAGGLCDAGRYSAHRLLSTGYSIFVVPGGATEALHSYPDEDVLYLKARKGFVRLAIQHGSSLVPVFSFNENNEYDQFDTRHPLVIKIRAKFQAIFGISLPLLKNIIPRRCQITTVVGKPIEVSKNPNPSPEEVEAKLNEYIEAITELYHRHEHLNIPKGKKLRII